MMNFCGLNRKVNNLWWQSISWFLWSVGLCSSWTFHMRTLELGVPLATYCFRLFGKQYIVLKPGNWRCCVSQLMEPVLTESFSVCTMTSKTPRRSTRPVTAIPPTTAGCISFLIPLIFWKLFATVGRILERMAVGTWRYIRSCMAPQTTGVDSIVHCCRYEAVRAACRATFQVSQHITVFTGTNIGAEAEEGTPRADFILTYACWPCCTGILLLAWSYELKYHTPVLFIIIGSQQKCVWCFFILCWSINWGNAKVCFDVRQVFWLYECQESEGVGFQAKG